MTASCGASKELCYFCTNTKRGLSLQEGSGRVLGGGRSRTRIQDFSNCTLELWEVVPSSWQPNVWRRSIISPGSTAWPLLLLSISTFHGVGRRCGVWSRGGVGGGVEWKLVGDRGRDLQPTRTFERLTRGFRTSVARLLFSRHAAARRVMSNVLAAVLLVPWWTQPLPAARFAPRESTFESQRQTEISAWSLTLQNSGNSKSFSLKSQESWFTKCCTFTQF